MLPRVPVRLVRRTTTLVSSVLAMVSLGSCEKVPLLAPTQSIITVVSSRSVLPISGTAQIIATVIEQSGTPTHNGTLVTFTTTLGTLQPREAVTRNGQAVVTLHAGTQSGIATITAFSGSAQSAAGADGTTGAPLTVTIGGAATAAISLTATPGTVPARGGTVTVVASVNDANGNLLPGVPVSFSASAGSLGATSVLTDGNGQATTTLTTDRDTTVTATSGGQTATATITVNNAPTITVTPAATPTVGEPTTFIVLVTAGSSAIREVSIDFGDGTSQSLGALTGSTNVTHTYRLAGTFTVVVTATDSTGDAVNVATVIVVEAAAPLNVTVTSSLSTVQVDVPVTFTATVTQAPSAGAPEIDRYEWSFGDGRTAVTTGNITSHVYTSAGRKSVEVRAVEKDGRTGTGRTEVNVTPRSPVNVNITAIPSPATVGEVVTFTAAVTGTTVLIDRYEWVFGDGAEVTTSGNIVNHVYTSAGTRTVRVTAVTVEGVDGSSQIQLVVTGGILNVNLTANPSPATVDEVVTITATVTPATVQIATYAWDFGDGTTQTTSGNIVNHVYTSSGTRGVRVTATTPEGVSGSTAITLIVVPVQIAITLTPSPPNPFTNSAVTFTAVVTPSTAVATSYFWEFGDVGTTSTTTSGNSTIFPGYAVVGDKSARVTATLLDGSTVTTTAIVAVRP